MFVKDNFYFVCFFLFSEFVGSTILWFMFHNISLFVIMFVVMPLVVVFFGGGQKGSHLVIWMVDLWWQLLWCLFVLFCVIGDSTFFCSRLSSVGIIVVIGWKKKINDTDIKTYGNKTWFIFPYYYVWICKILQKYYGIFMKMITPFLVMMFLIYYLIIKDKLKDFLMDFLKYYFS